MNSTLLNNRDLGAAKGEWWGFKGRPQGLQSGDEAELDWQTDRGKNQQAVFSTLPIFHSSFASFYFFTFTFELGNEIDTLKEKNLPDIDLDLDLPLKNICSLSFHNVPSLLFFYWQYSPFLLQCNAQEIDKLLSSSLPFVLLTEPLLGRRLELASVWKAPYSQKRSSSE